MNTHEFFRALYFSEIERKHHLTNALTVPTGIATILGGVIAYYVRSFDWQDIDVIGIVFVVLLIVSILLLGLMIYHLGKSYRRKPYSYLAYANELKAHHDMLIAEAGEVPAARVLAESLFEEHVNNQLAQYAMSNANHNEQREANLTTAHRFMVATLVALALCAVPFFMATA